MSGLYSPINRLAESITRPKGTGAEYMTELQKKPGYKPAEAEDRDLQTLMALPQMERAAFMEKLKAQANKFPLKMRELGQGQTHHEQYTLPGGENYREILLHTPMPEGKGFKGVPHHFGGMPNILASIMVKDRTSPEGKKILHLEEIQSDWHQQGRDRGYNTKDPLAKNESGNWVYTDPDGRQVDLGPSIDEETMRHAIGPKVGIVPYGPHAKDWHELALKAMIQHAAENGYDQIAINHGQTVADRYGLSAHVNEIAVPMVNPDGTRSIRIEPKEGQNIRLMSDANGIVEGHGANSQQFTGKHINDIVGQDMATKIMQAKENGTKFAGEGLKVGGKGMKQFYDKMVPTFLNKFGKKHGVQVQQGTVGAEPEWKLSKDANNQLVKTQVPRQWDAHTFDITPAMREDVLKNGIPRYDEGGIIHKAEGGSMNLTTDQMRAALMGKSNTTSLSNLQSVGANEAPSLPVKSFIPPHGRSDNGSIPVGGVDEDVMQPGQQMMPQQAPQQPPGQPQPGQPQAGALPQQGQPQPPQGPNSNILSLTPQGQAMAAMRPTAMASGGSAKSIDQMKAELAAKKAPVSEAQEDDEEDAPAPSKRILVKAEGPGGVTGIVIPHHMLHGRSWISKKTGKQVVVPGLNDINEARAKVYGSENRDPLTIGQIGKIHKDTLTSHFTKPLKEQLVAEKEATQRLREAKHLGAKNNTLDESEKLDTVRHETDEEGRTHVGFASKGVAGHALYISGHGKNQKHHIINTCPGQTEGCGGGKDAKGVIDTSKGTCFAPNSESQYVHAAVRRATHEQAKHDPAMTRDWILAHTGSMREAAKKADKSNQRLLFRPNVVDETDVSSRHAIRHLNEQRKAEDKPPIIANSYGKTNELHDPENGYYVTHSNVGPKVKKGQEIGENVGRDKARVRNTIMAADNRGDFTNEQGHKTPPKGSYMVTDVKRGSPMAQNMENAITHAKYWSTGREQSELTEAEKKEGPEGHFGPDHKPTDEAQAHYGHRTHEGLRYDYQRQHILHPRLVNVPIRKKNKKTGQMETKDHMIPTDSRFKDTEFLPKDRYISKNGKEAGHILMTTPTESTSNLGHETSFTHHVGQAHIEHAKKNNGEYEIDRPEDQAKAKGKEYITPQAIKFRAEGGSINVRHQGLNDDDFHCFPESNGESQRHLAMRYGEDESKPNQRAHRKIHIAPHNDMDVMHLALIMKKVK